MPQIIILPNQEFCPDGVVIETDTGNSICRALLDNGIEIEHACEMSNACTTCHIYVRAVSYTHLTLPTKRIV